MNDLPSANSLSISVRVYRTLLVAYPKGYRNHYETQMVQVFRDSLRESYHHGGLPGVVDLWIHTLFDLLFTALNERISERSRYMFSPKVVLWGGVAGAIGGFFWFMGALAPASGGEGFVLAVVLGLGGLVGLYSRQAGEGGKLGLAGLVLGCVGTILLLMPPFNVTAQGILMGFIGMVLLGIGLALLGITCLRAKSLNRWRVLPLGLGLLNIMMSIAFWLIYYVPLSQGRNPWHPWNPAAYLPFFVLSGLVGLGWMGLGFTLVTEANAEITPSETST